MLPETTKVEPGATTTIIPIGVGVGFGLVDAVEVEFGVEVPFEVDVALEVLVLGEVGVGVGVGQVQLVLLQLMKQISQGVIVQEQQYALAALSPSINLLPLMTDTVEVPKSTDD